MAGFCLQELAEACQFNLDDLKFEFPQELMYDGRTRQQALEGYTWQFARKKFGEHIPEKINSTLEHELAFIKRKNLPISF